AHLEALSSCGVPCGHSAAYFEKCAQSLRHFRPDGRGPALRFRFIAQKCDLSVDYLQSFFCHSADGGDKLVKPALPDPDSFEVLKVDVFVQHHRELMILVKSFDLGPLQ